MLAVIVKINLLLISFLQEDLVSICSIHLEMQILIENYGLLKDIEHIITNYVFANKIIIMLYIIY